MASYKLPLKSLSLGVQEFTYHLGVDFFSDIEPLEVRGGNVDAVVSVDRKSDDIYQIEMTLKGEITIPCDRCLDDMTWPVDTSYDLSVKEGDEYDDSRDNVLTIPSHWRELDLEPLLRDTVLLTIPIKHVHPEGGCNAQMLERLSQHMAAMGSDEQMRSDEGHDDTGSYTLGDDPRWEALRKLKDNN